MDPRLSPNEPQADWSSSEKLRMLQPAPPPYQDHPAYPNAGDPPPYPGQQYGAPVGLISQGPYPQQHVVTVQPAVYVTSVPLTNPLPDYLGYSIFTMLCCCFPLGVAALIYSCSTQDANRAGHQQLAEKNSRMARTLNNVGLGIGLVFTLFFFFRLFLAIYSRQH